MAKKAPYVPISKRGNSKKWRMYRHTNGVWVATQPFGLLGAPMFDRMWESGPSRKVGPSYMYVNRDPRKVLHELQLAMAKAAA